MQKTSLISSLINLLKIKFQFECTNQNYDSRQPFDCINWKGGKKEFQWNRKTTNKSQKAARTRNNGGLHIIKSINMMTIVTMHRSRSSLHLRPFLSHLCLLWSVMAPHQPHLNTGAWDGSKRRSPQPRHVVS